MCRHPSQRLTREEIHLKYEARGKGRGPSVCVYPEPTLFERQPQRVGRPIQQVLPTNAGEAGHVCNPRTWESRAGVAWAKQQQRERGWQGWCLTHLCKAERILDVRRTLVKAGTLEGVWDGQ